MTTTCLGVLESDGDVFKKCTLILDYIGVRVIPHIHIYIIEAEAEAEGDDVGDVLGLFDGLVVGESEGDIELDW